MRLSFKAAAAACLILSAPVLAQVADFPPRILPEWMEATQSYPKGWTLAYRASEGGVHLYDMVIDLDAHPQTAFLDANSQMTRMVCGDESLAQMVAGGLKIRVDERRQQGGRTTVSRGTVIRC